MRHSSNRGNVTIFARHIKSDLGRDGLLSVYALVPLGEEYVTTPISPRWKV